MNKMSVNAFFYHELMNGLIYRAMPSIMINCDMIDLMGVHR